MLKNIFKKFKKNNEINEEIISEEANEKNINDEVKEEIIEEIPEVEADTINKEEYLIDEDTNRIKEEDNESTVDQSMKTTEESTQEQPTEIQEPQEPRSFFNKLKTGLFKTRTGITEKIDSLLKSYVKIDDDFLEELEEILITSDIGMDTTMEIIDKLKDEIKTRKITDTADVKGVLKDVIEVFLTTSKSSELNIEPSPSIILVIGVNGVGKTTSIGKLAYNLKGQGKKVLLAAGDTFRAAAIDQLKIWGDRTGVNVIHHQEGSDPAAIIYDAIQAAKARKIDVLICDTAGRLHNKKNLMNELSKVFKIIEREYPEAKREVLLVLDATTGQNAIQQAKTFKEIADITGIILTKLDGTAKGGVILGITSGLDIPVKLIGVGEGKEDLQPFDPGSFAKALLSEN